MATSIIGILIPSERRVISFKKDWKFCKLSDKVSRLMSIMGYKTCDYHFITMIEFESMKPIKRICPQKKP